MPDLSGNDLLLQESDEQAQLMRSPNQMEAVMSGMEKRPAAYRDI